REGIVRHPLVQGAEQVRAFPGYDGIGHGGRRPASSYWRISSSTSVRLSRNERREKMTSMYLRIGWADAPFSSTPKDGRRHSTGAMLTSTRENSSLRKNFLAANTSVLAIRLSCRTLRSWFCCFLSVTRWIWSAAVYRSFSIR